LGIGHGLTPPRGQGTVTRGDPPPGRFGKMFPLLPACEAGPDAIEKLFELMEQRQSQSKPNTDVPAGFTYLGQFIDHDITFDPMSKLEPPSDPHKLVNFRTPRLDLDSVYGAGPQDEPFLYDWEESKPGGTKLLVGKNEVDPSPAAKDRLAAEDLPRNQQGRALVGDPRNDEHSIIAQLHLLFIRFHNAVVDHLRKTEKEEGLFDRAQQIVRWHYQWIVIHDFLPKVVGPKMTEDVLIARKYFKWRREPFIPVEFSGAAYRFGHSMARARYQLRRGGHGESQKTIPLFDGLAGLERLRESVLLDWDRFFNFRTPTNGIPLPQFSLKIDTSLAAPLFKLPEDKGALARLNLARGRALQLPSGQKVAKRLRARALKEDELLLDEQALGNARAVLQRSTPLWYYILCEAPTTPGIEGVNLPGSHLGPVGGRIVAEVLVGLLKGDPSSYLNAEKPWEPKELGIGKEFRMVDLIRFAGEAPA
jgi:hypothetical protein